MRSTLYSIHSMGQSGDTFVAARIESRDVDITGVIRERDPEQIRAHRRMLARILNPQLSATLTYAYGSFVRVIDCRSVNAPEITKSKKDVYYHFSVQLVCLNPFWREATETRSDIAAWVGLFEFPAEIPGIELGGMEFGYRMPSLIVNVSNGGDVETGMRAVFSALDAVSHPSLINMTTGEMISLNIDLVEGDLLTVSTGYGQKNAILRRNGEDHNALQYVDISSTFIQLQPGDNMLRYDADQGISNLEVSLFHSNLYLGV